jgi:hypothetical protein
MCQSIIASTAAAAKPAAAAAPAPAPLRRVDTEGRQRKGSGSPHGSRPGTSMGEPAAPAA